MCDRGISGVRPRKEILIYALLRTICFAVLKESLALSSQRQVDPHAADNCFTLSHSGVCHPLHPHEQR